MGLFYLFQRFHIKFRLFDALCIFFRVPPMLHCHLQHLLIQLIGGKHEYPVSAPLELEP